MNRLLKKVISGITTVSLGMAMVGSMPAIADDAAATSTVRTLSVDFMGRGATPQETSPGSARLNADDVGKEFWVGVAVDNVNDLPLFTDGIYSLELAFEYDPDFVEPYFTSENAETEWAAALESGNLAAANSSTWWNSEQYEIISVAETDINTTTDRENADVMAQREADGWKMCTVCVTLKSGASFDGARFKDLADGAKQYLLKLPFKLNSVPADDAVDTNPRVLSLVRGPETLDIGSGETGTDPYSAWEATVTDPNDATNMKTLFTFPGDISLFDAGGAIENIVPFKTETDAETGDVTETTYTLSTTKDLALDGFKTETLDYYLSVSNEIEKLKLRITSSELPTVTANTASVTATLTATDKVYETAEFDLAELDKSVEADGYNNTVTVTAGGTTYTLHIRRLLKPKIVLNPGNSPYGLIERMGVKYMGETDGWSEEVIEQAKTAFDQSSTVNKKYGTNLVPNNGQSKLTYVATAWRSYVDADGNMINYDLNPYALFAYQGSTFKEPGCIVYDEEGNLIEDAEITVDFTVKRQKSAGASKYNTDSGFENYNPALVNGTTDTYTLSGAMIRMDVYSMKYSCNYVGLSGETISLEAERPVIILSRRGDIVLSTTPTVNNGDVDYLKANTQAINSGNSLVAYRCMDFIITSTPTINNGDVDYLKANTQAINSMSDQYYKKLD